MPDHFHKRLSQHEVTPPPHIWEQLSARLDRETGPSDIRLSQKLGELSIPPPPSAWDAIAASLPAEIPATTAKPAVVRAIPARLQKLAAAAMLGAAALITVIYLVTGDGNPAPGEYNDADWSAAGASGALPQGHPLPDLAAADTDDSRKVQAERQTAAHTRSVRNVRNLSFGGSGYRSYSSKKFSAGIADFDNVDMEQASPDLLQPVSALEPVAVNAPPIRDPKGNIILDLDVISHPSEPYIVVTGPNGIQTRISTKFLPLLSSLNSELTAAEISMDDMENVEWKIRFQEWRNRLIRDASFVPTANNFFDIFELKEMIQER